jgi:hypothetical protein
MFCAPRLIFGDSEGVGSRFHVLRARTHFRRRRVPFSCFELPESFSAIPKTSGPIFMFCNLRLIFDGSEGVASRFLVLRLLLVSDPTDGVRFCFHVLCSRTRIRRFRGRRVLFSCFTSTYSFSALSRASGPVFMFCAPGLVFGDTEGVRSRFHVLCYRTHSWRFHGRQVPFSYFASPYSFSTVPRASGPVFLFCVPVLIFDGSEGFGSRFLVLRPRTRFRQ